MHLPITLYLFIASSAIVVATAAALIQARAGVRTGSASARLLGGMIVGCIVGVPVAVFFYATRFPIFGNGTSSATAYIALQLLAGLALVIASIAYVPRKPGFFGGLAAGLACGALAAAIVLMTEGPLVTLLRHAL